jgi:class 3 adenylate cyclase/tetratricopeptide (TPR) repeat protein
MSSIWQSFVPYRVVQELIADPHVSPVGREKRSKVVALFADVSGFTAMSEALGRFGKSGTEDLTVIINHYFEPMIDLIRSYGGIIGKFGGDAMTVIFPCETDAHSGVVNRALQCALDMQARMGNYEMLSTRAGTFSLEMKAGLAIGTVMCTTIGDPALRLEYIIAGNVLDRCADAEHHANKGEIVIENELKDFVEGIDSIDLGNGFSLVRGIEMPVAPAPLPGLPDLPESVNQILSAYVHPSIAERVQRNQLSFINEHRKVTVMFIGFTGFDYDNDLDVAAKLQDYFSEVIKIINRYDGYLNKVDMGDKGSKYIVLFGAPLAHEDDDERALRCALELQNLSISAVHIGINTGNVYSGQVGSVKRQEYTVMGDAVNLAARLMQLAQPGQILASENTFDGNQNAFVWQLHDSVMVKGKSDPIQLYELIRLRRQGTMRLKDLEYTLPMVGRKAEIKLIKDAIAKALKGEGQIVGITAEAGMGKSRLATEIIPWAIAQGFSDFGSECLSHGMNTSYLVWQQLFRSFFDVPVSATLDEQLDHLDCELEVIDPSFVQRKPLLGRVLDIPISDNRLTRSMDAKLKKESLEALLVSSINYRARENPLMIILEDCHWIDPLSNDLLEAIGRNIASAPVLLLVIYRPPGSRGTQPKITDFGYFTEIRLTEFTQEETESLIGLKLEQLFGESIKVPDEVIKLIAERAQGNPFYIDEMLNLIYDQKIDPTDIESFYRFDLPDSLHSLILSRIDQLAENTKTTLKVASVIGRSFKANWLWGVYPQLGVPERVKAQLELLSQMDITPLDKPEPELEYLFRHIITREVAYESLAVATREMLHDQIGQYIERMFPDELERFIDLLAYHYGNSPNAQKQQEYLRKAGEAARRTYANDAAIGYYKQLVQLLAEDEQCEIWLELGRIWRLIGEWDETEKAVRKALKLAEQSEDQDLQAQSEYLFGTLLRYRGQYTEASDWLNKANAKFDKLKDQDGILNAMREIGVLYWVQGNFQDALLWLERSKAVATKNGDKKGICRAVGNMGLVYELLGDSTKALEHHIEGYRIAKESKDYLNMGVISGNMGNVYLMDGRYHRALESYMRCLQIALELGDRQGVSYAVGNVGTVYFSQGDYSASLTCQSMNLQIALELGDTLGISMALWYLALNYMELKQFEIAGRLLSQAIQIARNMDIQYDLCEYIYYYARLLTQQGDITLARQNNQEALTLANQVDHPEIQLKAELLAIRLKALANEIDHQSAIVAFEQLSAGEDDIELDPQELASIHYEIWRLDNDQTEHRNEAAGIYHSLFAQSPNVTFSRRYEEMTGQKLPAPPRLPPLPEIVTRNQTDLTSLLKQVDIIVDRM